MSETKPMRVAIAGDQAIYRRGLASLMMSIKDVQLVGEAQNGAEALQLCELLKPDLLLLDLRSPVLNEGDAARLIHIRWPHLKLICLADLEAGQQPARPPEEPFFLLPRDISEEGFIDALRQICQGRLPAPSTTSRDSSQVEYIHQLVNEIQQFTSNGNQADNEQLLPLVQSLAARVSRAVEQTRSPGLPTGQDILTHELVMAGKIQTDILPEQVPSIPGWDIAARLEPARETSGDFYDFIPVANKNIGIVIADVTDKGMGAALFMALSNTLIRTYAVRYPSLPALTISAVNDRILSDTRSDMFVTTFFGVLEPHTGRLRYVNAGHHPPYLISTQKGKSIDRLNPTGMALGVVDGAHWQQKIVKLSAGDILILYTDGITEAQNSQGVFFGEQRLLEVVRSKNCCSAREIQEAVFAEVHYFVGDRPRQDDMALTVICRKE